MSASAHQAWVDSVLTHAEACGAEGATAVAYLRKHRTKIGFWRARSNVGAFWTPFRNIRLNSAHYSYDTPMSTVRLLTLVIHEARHLQQGPAMALSVYGELDAWQMEFGLFRRLTGKELPPALVELTALPLSWDRNVLRDAQRLMQVYAGKGYRADLLPLYPIHHELAYLLFRKVPAGDQATITIL